MTYEEVVADVKERFKDTDVSYMKEHLVYQFNIVGEGAGAFYVEVNDGKLIIQPYEYFDRDVLLTCSADVLLKMVSGKLDPELAYMLKKLKIEGDLGKALKLKKIIAS